MKDQNKKERIKRILLERKCESLSYAVLMHTNKFL